MEEDRDSILQGSEVRETDWKPGPGGSAGRNQELACRVQLWDQLVMVRDSIYAVDSTI